MSRFRFSGYYFSLLFVLFASLSRFQFKASGTSQVTWRFRILNWEDHLSEDKSLPLSNSAIHSRQNAQSFFRSVRVVALSSNSLSLEVYGPKSPHHHWWTPIKHILWGVLVLIKNNRKEEVWTQFTSREMLSPFSTSIFIFCVMSSWRQILTWYQDIILLNIKHFYPTCVSLEHRFVGFRKRWCLAWTPVAHSTRGDGSWFDIVVVTTELKLWATAADIFLSWEKRWGRNCSWAS